MCCSCRVCLKINDKKQTSAGEPVASSPAPWSGPPMSATIDSAKATAASSQAMRNSAIPRALSPCTAATLRDIWSKKIATFMRSRASSPHSAMAPADNTLRWRSKRSAMPAKCARIVPLRAPNQNF